MVLTLPLQLDGGSTFQLLTAREPNSAREAGLRLLRGETSRERSVVAITVERSGESFVDAWLGHARPGGDDLTVVDVGAETRSSAAGVAPSAPTQSVVQSVGSVDDLASIRGRVEDLVGEPVSPGQQRLLYLDSVTGLLEEAGLHATLAFVVALRDLAERTGAIGFVRAHQPPTSAYAAAVVDSLVDATLVHSPRSDGDDWSIRAGRTAVEAGATAEAPGLDDVFGLLADRRRRLVLQFLLAADGPLSTSDLASNLAEVVLPEGDRADGRALKRLYTGLVFNHLPTLAEAEVVSVDADGEAVRLGAAAEHLAPLLALSAGGDLRG